ncbi:hypothetical protein [Bacillus paranthracis]|uniref:hypothetical protein n=1 Tax=Bacillus paranthracis TaxID=2026186 RepID=UPI001EF3C5F6|nr:hypothetical protein [Bacillus paranthracis]
MGKVSGNRKGLKPETVVTLWENVKTKITVKELCNVLELPRSTFYRFTTNGRFERWYRRENKGRLS